MVADVCRKHKVMHKHGIESWPFGPKPNALPTMHPFFLSCRHKVMVRTLEVPGKVMFIGSCVQRVDQVFHEEV